MTYFFTKEKTYTVLSTYSTTAQKCLRGTVRIKFETAKNYWNIWAASNQKLWLVTTEGRYHLNAKNVWLCSWIFFCFWVIGVRDIHCRISCHGCERYFDLPCRVKQKTMGNNTPPAFFLRMTSKYIIQCHVKFLLYKFFLHNAFIYTTQNILNLVATQGDLQNLKQREVTMQYTTG